jgi:hypothetical protein
MTGIPICVPDINFYQGSIFRYSKEQVNPGFNEKCSSNIPLIAHDEIITKKS